MSDAPLHIDLRTAWDLIAKNVDGMVVVDGDNTILFANPAGATLLGYPGEEEHLVGQRVARLAADRSGAFEAPGAAPEDGFRQVEKRRTPFRWNGEDAILLTLRDVTDRRRMERELLQGQKMSALGLLAGGIAHDFNNLLQGIVASIELGRSHVSRKDSAHPHLTEAIQSAIRAGELASRLLSFTRSKDEAAGRAVDLARLVEELAPVLRRLAGRPVRLKVEVTEDHLPVEAHPSDIEQILLNLLTNARDAVGTGGNVKLIADSITNLTGPVCRLIVEDDGEGMDPDVLERCTEPFFTTKQIGKGTGLGLAIVYDVVNRAGGSLEIASTPGQGTRIEVSFPRTALSESPSTIDREPVPTATGGRILLVDDEPTIRTTLQAALEAAGYDVETARNGGHALAIWRKMEPKPDLLLTDVAMPELDGIELSRLMTARQPGLKVLLMSGYGDRVLAAHGQAPEEVGLLDKPFRLATVLRRVAEKLAGIA